MLEINQYGVLDTGVKVVCYDKSSKFTYVCPYVKSESGVELLVDKTIVFSNEVIDTTPIMSIQRNEVKEVPIKKVYVTKEFTFDSCHHLIEYDGPCSRPHGHTYKLQVTLSKNISMEQSFVLDFNTVKSEVTKHLIQHLDHYDLNEVVSYNPTAENMVVDFYEILALAFSKVDSRINVEEIKLWETPTSYATYKGE